MKEPWEIIRCFNCVHNEMMKIKIKPETIQLLSFHKYCFQVGAETEDGRDIHFSGGGDPEFVRKFEVERGMSEWVSSSFWGEFECRIDGKVEYKFSDMTKTFTVKSGELKGKYDIYTGYGECEVCGL